jgi:hypothetical protein
MYSWPSDLPLAVGRQAIADGQAKLEAGRAASPVGRAERGQGGVRLLTAHLAAAANAAVAYLASVGTHLW